MNQMKELGSREVQICRRYQVDIKDTKYLLSIVGETQIHISHCWLFGSSNIRHYKIPNWDRKDFFFNCHINKFKKMSFTKDQFGEVVSKSWYNDSKVGSKWPFNLVELIEKDLTLKESWNNLKVHLNRMKL